MSVVLITGCSTGIGYATALRLARDGFEVVATMRNPSACDLATVAAAEGLTIKTRALDVTDHAAIDALIGELVRTGGIEVLVNNAGLGGSGGVVEETSLDAFREIMETNFFGAMACTKAVLPSMRERGRGCIVNVTSQAGRFAIPGMAPYCASKWALEAASESLAGEVAPFGIRVALIEPGAIMTAIWTKVDMTPPTGVYAPKRNRLAKMVMADLAEASTADEVATCISESISTDKPRLRWLVGQGAARNISLREGWTDEEYMDVWNQPDDDAFLAQMTAE
jgi:NAD(P)-dependent dehydrogenase (short-subunit alcohol dehydrogenase family)